MLRQDEHEITGCFYNPNIHPCREYQRRLETLKDYAAQQNLEVLWPEGYDMEEFLRNVVFREADRCYGCYSMRLRYTAEMAKDRAFDAFSTTLLYSIYQRHDLIRSIGESLAKELGISFYYRDFRAGWSEGVRISKEIGLYRQPYCGCIYSEKERYWRTMPYG
jgi:epoxyqueuosine reductase